ncbi:MAG: dCTP deaminase [Spirochaetota bacterium]
MSTSKNVLLSMVKDYIHEGKQFSEEVPIAYLTVNRIGVLTGRGSLDFGGSEYSEAEVGWLEPRKKQEDDKYGWWHLPPGSYLIEFNESVELPTGSRVYLQIWDKAGRNGIHHSFGVLEESRSPIQTVVTVGPEGIDIKENARLSQIGLL